MRVGCLPDAVVRCRQAEKGVVAVSDHERRMETAVITHYRDFSSLRDEWNQLCARASFRHPQLAWEWFDAALRHQQIHDSLLVITLRKRGRLVGAAPLMIRREPIGFKRKLSTRRLVWIKYIADAVDFIVDEQGAEAALQLIWETIAACTKWESLRLDTFSTRSPLFDLHRRFSSAVLPKARWLAAMGSPFVAISGTFEAYYKALRRTKAIADIERRMRRLEEQRGAVRVCVSDVWSDADYERMKALDLKRRERSGHITLVARPDRAAWLNDIRDTLNRQKKWLVITMYDPTRDAVPIAYCVCFNHESGIYFWTTSYDPDYGRYSAGKAILKYALEEAWKRNAQMFDFMAGHEPYKLQWNPENAMLYSVACYRKRIKEYAEKGWVALRARIKGN